MRIMLASMKCVTFLIALAGCLVLSSCQEPEESKIKVKFEAVSASVEEDDQIEIVMTLSKPAKKTEYITVSVTSADAEFGTDYGIDNLIFPTDKFTVVVEKESSSASFTVNALGDFENESAEDVNFQIEEISTGLTIDDPAETTITITNLEDYPEDNRALSFDGVDDYVDLGNIYDDLALPVTISAWVWLDPTAPVVALPIFDSQDGLPIYNGINFSTSIVSTASIQYGDGKGENSVAYRRAFISTFSPIAGRWVNLTGIMRSATDMELFFNGVEIGGSYNGTSNLPMNSTSPNEVAKIGYYYANGLTTHFKGKLDELRIWNRALTTEEIQEVIFKKIDKTHPGLIGYWNFDEPTGNGLLDQSNNKFNGTLMGNPTRVLSEVPVK